MAVTEMTLRGQYVEAVAYAFPWVALMVMTIGWVLDKKVAIFWPIAGGMAAIPWALLSIITVVGILFALPAFALGVVLVQFHLELGRYKKSAAS